MIRRFLIDVAVAVPAVMVASMVFVAVIDGPLCYAIWKERRGR